MNSKKEFDYEEFEHEAIRQLQNGISLSGKNSVLALLLKRLLEAGLQGELNDHLQEEKVSLPEVRNRRNGVMRNPHVTDRDRTAMGLPIYDTVRTPAGDPAGTPLPVAGKDLHESRFTRLKKELFDFEQTDSGKTAVFCIRYENNKGRTGQWGPMFSAVIP